MTLLQKLALIQIQENRSFKYLLLSLTFILEPNDKTPDFSQSPGHLPQKPSPFTHFYLNFHISLTFSLLLAADYFPSPNDNKFKFETTFSPISDQHIASCNLIYTADTPGPGRNFTSLRPGQAAGQRSANSWAWLLKLGWYMVKNQLISVSCAQNQYWSLYSLFFGTFGPF